MNATATAPNTHREKSDPPSENRVWGFESYLSDCTGSNQLQTAEGYQEIFTTDTTTASGIFSWLSKDPIGIAGGLNMYEAMANNPVNVRDPYGLWNLWSPGTWGVPNGVGYNWYDSLNPYHESAGREGAWEGGINGGLAFVDGLLPVLNPFQSFYEDECGEIPSDYQFSRLSGKTVAFIESSLLLPALKGSAVVAEGGVSASVGTKWFAGNFLGIGTANSTAQAVAPAVAGILLPTASGVSLVNEYRRFSE